MKIKKIKPLLIWAGFILVIAGGALWFIRHEQTRLREITLAVIADTGAEKKAALFKKVKNVIVFSDEFSVLEALDEDRIDAALIDLLTGLSMINMGEFFQLKLAGNLIDRESIAVAFHPEDNALRQAINAGLQKIIDNGIYAQISHRYFGLDIASKYKLSDDQLREQKATDDSWQRILNSGSITVAFFDNNWPFSYFDDDDQLTGFNFDIAQSVCRELEIGLIPVVYPRNETVVSLKKRYFDCIWSNIPVTDYNDNDIRLSNPFYVTGLHLFTKKGSGIENLD